MQVTAGKRTVAEALAALPLGHMTEYTDMTTIKPEGAERVVTVRMLVSERTARDLSIRKCCGCCK